jgi:hypothetical protein
MSGRKAIAPPLWLALYFVLTLAADNDSESVHLSDLSIPLGASALLAVVAFAVARLALKEPSKDALLATTIVVCFSLFGRVVSGLATAWNRPPDVVALGVLSWVGILPVLGYLALRRARLGSVASAARFVTFVSGILCTFAAGRVAWQHLITNETTQPVQSMPAANPDHSGDRLPDIYLLVLDKYTGSTALAQHYGFDNGPFETFLKRRGFVVPRAARANYMHTFLALAAMLNARYLDELPDQLGAATTSRRPVDPLVEQNWTMSFLRKQGYRIVFFPTAFPTTRRNRFADLQIPSPDRIRPEFVTAWLWTTPLPVAQEIACRILGCTVSRTSFTPEAAEMVDWKFQQLEQLAGGSQPVFAFLHLVIPHEPYMYWADCRHRRPYWPARDDGVDALKVKAAYVEQIRCLNRKLERLVEVLQAGSRTPPVIVLQSDHGHGRFGRSLPDYSAATPEQREERASVFSAYALPGVRTSGFSDSITPINAMRFILREYFGAPLPPVEDLTYWSSKREPYRYVRF